MMEEILQSLVDFHYNTTTRFIKDPSMIFLGTSVHDCSSELIRSYSKVVQPQTERIQLCSFFIQLCLMVYGGWRDFGSVRERNRFSNEGTEMHWKHSLWLKRITFTTVLNQQSSGNYDHHQRTCAAFTEAVFSCLFQRLVSSELQLDWAEILWFIAEILVLLFHDILSHCPSFLQTTAQ